MSRRAILRTGAIVLAAVGVGVQFVPVAEVNTNPPHRFQIDASPEVSTILRRACYDCHSNETHWPLYSRIAPGSWLMARDVHRGRNHLNFSEWGSVDEDERQDDLEACWDQVESGEMPPRVYLPLHPAARLSEWDKATLKTYFLRNANPASKAASKTASTEPSGPRP
jgi:hypothetical protein